jgi:hypothetical protein
MNVIASTNSAQPGFAATTITPPIAGPTMRERERLMSSSAFASCRCAWLTACGVSPADAGRVNAFATPNTTCSSATRHTVA